MDHSQIRSFIIWGSWWGQLKGVVGQSCSQRARGEGCKDKLHPSEASPVFYFFAASPLEGPIEQWIHHQLIHWWNQPFNQITSQKLHQLLTEPSTRGAFPTQRQGTKFLHHDASLWSAPGSLLTLLFETSVAMVSATPSQSLSSSWDGIANWWEDEESTHSSLYSIMRLWWLTQKSLDDLDWASLLTESNPESNPWA